MNNKITTTDAVRTEIRNLLTKHPNKNFSKDDISSRIGSILKNSHPSIPVRVRTGDVLDMMVADGDVIVADGRYRLRPTSSHMEGVIDITPSGAAFLLSEDDEDDVFIAPRNVRTALHGDRVRVQLHAHRKGRRVEGEVVEVLSRAKTEFVGVVRATGRTVFVVPDSPRMLVDVYVPAGSNGKALGPELLDGKKVVVEIVDWPRGAKSPVGRIVRVIGEPGESRVEMESILVEYGFDPAFPPEVEAEAEAIPAEIPQEEIGKRRDMRDVHTVTIDPVDAKDFDDAISFRSIKSDLGDVVYEVGIHIADVSHYVRPGTALDEEARRRATSVYLVDRVVPMLPERLSNGICSLRPDEDKLCFSVVVNMSVTGEVLDAWVGRTVIRSDKRHTYESAQQEIEACSVRHARGDISLLNDPLWVLHCLAQGLRRARMDAGAIAFERAELKFELDGDGRPLRTVLKESKESNWLVEEFMLLANRLVAERGQSGAFVYRVHDRPDADKLRSLAAFAAKFGRSIPPQMTRGDINRMLSELHGAPEQALLEMLAVRAMAKAVYATENIGHYGLAFDNYTHFTSPIRRYPDVMVHRLVAGGGTRGAEFFSGLADDCKHCTQAEIAASSAERASVKYKQAEFLSAHIGEEFDGTVSGVTERGIYVEITENGCEGMVRLSDIDDDFYEFDSDNYAVVGSRTGRKISLGDRVRVAVTRTDLARRQVDMAIK